jgi:hypothetical protein
MPITALLFDIGLGAAIGFLGGLFGVGGGIIAIPVLGLMFGLDQQVAQGTAMVMIVPNVLLGLWRYYKRGGLNLAYALVLGVTAVVFTYAAAEVAVGLRSAALRAAFGVFVACMAVLLAWQTWRKTKPEAAQARATVTPTEAASRAGAAAHPAWGWGALVGAAGGVLSGLFGVGGATIAPPLLTTFYGFKQAAAQGLALALVAPGAIVGLATYAKAGAVNWPQGLALATGGMLLVSRGVSVAYGLPERKLKLFFCGLLVVTAGVMIASSLG